MVLLEFSLAPMDKGQSVSPYVARCLSIIDSSGLDYRLHAMGTIIEGELEEVLDVFKRCVEALGEDCDRITGSAKLDFRRGYRGRLETKVDSVEQHLGKRLKSI
jgi:uncharacterized protein (TIGR00106 family)